MMTAKEMRGWVGVKELAEWMGVSEKSVRCAVSRGEIPFHRIGGSIRFILREVEAATACNLGGAVAVNGKQQRKAE